MTEYQSVIQKGPATIAEQRRERAVIVGVDRPGLEWPLESSLAELDRLADTAGADVVASTTQRLDAPNPRTFVGSGKAVEIADLARSCEADLVIFDDELTPSQQANLEKILDKSVKVIDRTALILDIFALHATSKEGRLQVRLAQNQYLYPRLRGMWAHLASNRMGGGVGSRFGEGESQLEVDRRMVRKRITSIRRELAHLSEVRSLQRENRYGSGMFKVSLAGYTNAGKSSLINRLTGAAVLSYDKLFATLDSTTRKFSLPEGREVTVTDTVGFIQKLPTTLVEAFRSTLDEITGADLILHVIDASSPEFEGQIDAVCEVLDQIGAESIAAIEVFNKCDLLLPPRSVRLGSHRRGHRRPRDRPGHGRLGRRCQARCGDSLPARRLGIACPRAVPHHIGVSRGRRHPYPNARRPGLRCRFSGVFRIATGWNRARSVTAREAPLLREGHGITSMALAACYRFC